MKSAKEKPFRSLTTTVTLTFLVFNIFILFISLGLETYFSFKTQQKDFISHQYLVAQSSANVVSNFLEEKFKILDQASDTNNLIDNTDRRDLVTNKLIGHNASFRQIFIINNKGQELFSVSRLPTMNQSQFVNFKNDLLINTINNEKYISPIYIDDDTNEPIILIAVPAKNIFNESEGAIVAELNLKFIWDLVAEIKVGQNGLAYVVDNNGYLIAFGDTSRALKHEDLSYLTEVSRFKDGITEQRASISKGILGTYSVSSHFPLGFPDWAVIVELPFSEAYKSILQIFASFIIIGLFSVILAVSVGFYFAKRITKGIIDLNTVAEQISHGKFGSNIDILIENKNNEIGQLANSFNIMTGKLQDMYNNMDMKVKEKTDELTNKLGELEHVNKLMIDRELKMIELKKEIETLKNKS